MHGYKSQELGSLVTHSHLTEVFIVLLNLSMVHLI